MQNISKWHDLYQPGGGYTGQWHLEAFPRQHLNPQLHSHGRVYKYHPLAWCFTSVGKDNSKVRPQNPAPNSRYQNVQKKATNRVCPTSEATYTTCPLQKESRPLAEFPALNHANHKEDQGNKLTYPSNFLFLRMGLFTECRGLRLTLRSWILMLASCSAWACWIPATTACM